MKKKNLSSKHPSKKRSTSSRANTSRAASSRKKERSGPAANDFQAGFAEPHQRRMIVNYEDDTLGIP